MENPDAAAGADKDDALMPESIAKVAEAMRLITTPERGGGMKPRP